MRAPALAAALCLGLSATAPPAAAALVFRIGDTVYVDGKQYTWEEWKKLRDSAAVKPPPAAADPSAGAPSLRAASCITPIYYDQFPSEDERFDCSGGLGALTREEILRAGWKIDFVDKIPAERAGLSKYKLIISR
jgi:hypothetical protein